MLLEVVLLLLMSVAVLYEWSPRFRYNLRFMVMYGGALLVGICVAPLGLLRPCDARNSLLFTRPLRLVGLLLGIRWQVRGAQHLQPDRACIVVANHQSAVDVLGMVELWPRLGRVVTVMKKEIWLGLPFALACWLCGQLFIDRSNATRARASLERAAQRMLDERLAVWFYPEGTRNRSGTGLLPFKKGAFHMAVRAQVPVVPVVFGPYRAFLEPARCHFEPGLAVAQVLDPIPTEGLGVDDVPQLLERVQGRMAEAYCQLSEELDATKAT
ncbi:1-acyl-sn-glycerol-3-phosphate acyltransferase alpha-like [Pollicipes pollicipes]|nr:1-acyl-sn-glycerol-3-phosphate acyltransferase alpha-like [Pollicipes pollicipes]XP_037086717.1 1-acyl-sn-glycerol-3-phosphate acyltransferase alpha-like [Pollicipes pollicipes]